MNLIDDARAVLRHAWSVRFSALSSIFGAVEALRDWLPFVGGVIPPRVAAALAAVSALGALVSRFVPQRKLQEARDGR